MSDLADQAVGYHADAERLRKAGDFDAALSRQRRAVALWREAGDTVSLAHAVRHIADMLVEAGRAREASDPIAEMIALYARHRDAPPLDIANALRSAAIHAEAIGDGDTAEAFWLKARQRYAALDELFEQLTGQPGQSRRRRGGSTDQRIAGVVLAHSSPCSHGEGDHDVVERNWSAAAWPCSRSPPPPAAPAVPLPICDGEEGFLTST